MEALSTLTIGNNVLRVRVRAAQERLVAALATAQAGYTPATRNGARTSPTFFAGANIDRSEDNRGDVARLCQAPKPARTLCERLRRHPRASECPYMAMNAGLSPESLRLWANARQEQLEADFTRAWGLDPVIAAHTAETGG
jgi:hypothetical protein